MRPRWFADPEFYFAVIVNVVLLTVMLFAVAVPEGSFGYVVVNHVR